MKTHSWFIALVGCVGLLFASAGLAAQENSASDQATDMSMMKMNIENGENWFGGPIYNGEPALAATAALVRAGGGADNFSFAQALVSMLGQETVNAEVAKLNAQYGEEAVKLFISGMDYAVKTGLKLATNAGITLPEAPADLKGVALAKALVKAGTADDGVFWSGHLFDVALSHNLHNAVMADIEANVSHQADKSTHQILNQAMFDVAQALGMSDVKLASFH